MKSGCLLALLLLPITILIWAKRERQRRASLPPEELKTLEDEEKYGEIGETVECIYCHKKGCVRVSTKLEESLTNNLKRGGQYALIGIYAFRKEESRKGTNVYKARCMNCGSYWDMFDPSEKTNS